MTTRRTVDITVDAYDAPMLAALAKRLTHIRSLGHPEPRVSPRPQGWRILAHDVVMDAAAIKEAREEQAFDNDEGPEALTILMGEVAEVIEARCPQHLVDECIDVAAVGVRIASKMARGIDAKGGE